MADLERFGCRFANACSYALAKFELGEFKEKESKALKRLILVRNASVILLTGSGKRKISNSVWISRNIPCNKLLAENVIQPSISRKSTTNCCR